MDNNLKVFESEEFGSVRTVEQEGKILFCGSDVTKCLGYANSSKALNDHCKGITKRYTPTKGGNQELSYITEGDLYRLIAHSKLESAQKFESWVFEEVLPSIRKHGMYATPITVDNLLNNPALFEETLKVLKEERERRIEAEKTNAILMHTNKVYTATEIAKENGFRTAQELNSFLEENKVQYKVNGTWIPTADYANMGYFEIKQEVLDSGTVIYHRKITQSGRKFINNLILERKEQKAS